MDISFDEIRAAVPPHLEYPVEEGEYERILGEIERKSETELIKQRADLIEIDNPNPRVQTEIELIGKVLEAHGEIDL